MWVKGFIVIKYFELKFFCFYLKVLEWLKNVEVIFLKKGEINLC